MPSLFTTLVFSALFTFPQAPTFPQAQMLAPAPTAVQAKPAEDPAITSLALKIYAQMRAGKVDAALLTDAMNQQLSPEILAQTKPMFDQLGAPTVLTFESAEASAQGTQYRYLAVFATAQLHVKIFVTKDGKVGGYVLAP